MKVEYSLFITDFWLLLLEGNGTGKVLGNKPEVGKKAATIHRISPKALKDFGLLNS